VIFDVCDLEGYGQDSDEGGGNERSVAEGEAVRGFRWLLDGRRCGGGVQVWLGWVRARILVGVGIGGA
jgi:hypothetical protein